MLTTESKISVMDNSGVYTAKIISLYGKPSVKPPNIVLVAIDKHRRGKIFNKKYLCLLTTSRIFEKRTSGIFVRFDLSSGILLKDRESFLGSKFYGPFNSSCKSAKINKIHFIYKWAT